MLNFLILIFIVFKTSTLSHAQKLSEWVVWNVGQGQWVTHVQSDRCLHYDIGGELGTFKHVKKKLHSLCYGKQNQLVLSHWDFDHYSNLVNFAKRTPRLCWLSQPASGTEKRSAQIILTLELPACAEQIELSASRDFWKPSVAHNTNESSGVYQDGRVLIPGDSAITEEKKWSKALPNLNRVQILILGHHGSRTSTGENLLLHLKSLQMAIASARYAKYRHPDRLTIQRLQKHKVPVLKTEDFGDLHFEE